MRFEIGAVALLVARIRESSRRDALQCLIGIFAFHLRMLARLFHDRHGHGSHDGVANRAMVSVKIVESIRMDLGRSRDQGPGNM